jgi:hypothetical protein
LSVLESQFEEEIAVVENNHTKEANNIKTIQKTSQQQQPSPVASEDSNRSSGLHSRSSSGGSGQVATSNSHQDKQTNGSRPPTLANGKRTESPDTDSAFCDNLSVLSSCSTSSGTRSSNATDAKSSSGMSSTNSTPSQEEQEAKIKAEKIKVAIEKIKEANIKKLFIKVFTSDGSAKSLLVDEKMSVNYVTRILAEKNHVKLEPKWTLVELCPDLYMERVYEDHENLVENCLMWTIDSKNTLWFIERPEKFDVFLRPERYLLGSSSSQCGDTMEDHARQELLEEYFSSSGVGAPELEGFVWLKADSKKSWKKFFFVLRTSGLYYAPKGKKTSKDLVCLATFDVNQVYYGAGWKKKYKAPSDYCFAIKHPKIQAKTPKYMRYLCVDSEKELHQWVTGIRVAKNGKHLFSNYRGIEDEMTHADIDILTSKRFSVNSPNTLQINGQPISLKNGTNSPARTPSSENKSLDSALSSGIVSDMSNTNSFAESARSSTDMSNSNAIGPDIIEVTPVNTIERHSGQLRRSMSKASTSSSSSGCPSSSSGTIPQIPQTLLNGFESDFPMGGTIKKRPSIVANYPKIPLTNTTRGIVRDSDDDISLGSGDNVRVGGGGTLLRSAVRQSLRKNSFSQEKRLQDFGGAPSPRGSTPDLIQPQQHLHTAVVQVHSVDQQNDDLLSQEFESNLNSVAEEEDILPLPPPPRAESIAQHLNTIVVTEQQQQQLPTNPSHDLDDLPPPPPEMCQDYQVNQPIQQLHHQGLPNMLPPSSLKKSPPFPPQNSHRMSSTKRISFDDDVRVIGVSEPEIDIEQEKRILTYLKQPYIASPKKLFSNESKSQATPPPEFLADLQRVMTKKWKVAEKCKEEVDATPHQVLGFRDNEIQHLVGTGQNYSRDESVGAWVLHSQQYARPPVLQKEPLYAVCSKNGGSPNHHNKQQPMHYAPSPKKVPPPVPPPRPPVVLREPTPELTHHQIYQNGSNHQQYPPHHMANLKNGSHYQVQQGRPMMQVGAGAKRAPPPPRRSETTHLTTPS